MNGVAEGGVPESEQVQEPAVNGEKVMTLRTLSVIWHSDGAVWGETGFGKAQP
jgi:hypothetical protein